MQSELKKLTAEFELEMWLYLEESLSIERKKFWDIKMTEYPELKNMLIENNSLVSAYDELPLENIADETFNKMIDNAVKPNRILLLFEKLFSISPSIHIFDRPAVKISFAVSLVAIAFVLFLISERPNAVNQAGAELFSWEGTEISEQIESVNSSIEFIKDEDIAEYLKWQTTKNEFNRSVNSVNNRIRKLKSNIKQTSF